MVCGGSGIPAGSARTQGDTYHTAAYARSPCGGASRSFGYRGTVDEDRPLGGQTRRAAPGEEPAELSRLTVWVRGRVQGVGFRWWTRARALELGLRGSASNLEDGRVEVVAEGDRASCEHLLELLGGRASPTPPEGAPRSWYPRPGRVTGVTCRWSRPLGVGPGFVER